MTSEILRRAAADMRAKAEAATPGPWSAQGAAQVMPPMPWTRDPWWRSAVADVTYGALHQNRQDAAHIAAWHPAVALAVADWLDRCAVTHRPEQDEVYLIDCEECIPGDCEGHERECCWGCAGNGEDGYVVRVFYPCAEMTDALTVARTYLNEQP